ncbi:NAD(P)-binding Rossmann-fold superfamily protein [Artemisia annua]|uniref:NAD(P)-binding Rossmann-fold superfamily protein n=1 Tax=Artemisia annua TaxID=35608 RepID=A0A2U1MHS5_ARTAN|nr:NAD(P)-binding Rossmann-fold superfamily protein [Artemisia annua]
MTQSTVKVVCVTGGSGYIGSWLISLLLDRGYTVNATVKDLKDENETNHLEALEGAETRLRLFQMDLLDYESIVAAVSGVSGVFHVASPCTVDKVHDPEKTSKTTEYMTQSTVKVVCVTGGSGYIGSWLISLLLDRGYTVNATVKDLKDENETKHLEALEGAETRLRLFQMDLLDYGSIVAAVSGVSGVFHVASPCTVDKVHDPEKDLLSPALKGTINVLTAAKKLGVKRVVITSSASAIAPSPTWPSNIPKSEDCWTDVEYCKQNELWYPLSKTLAEKAAWDFAKEKGLDIVVVNPTTVMGPIIPPTLNASMLMILRLIQGCTDTYENNFMCSVHVKDVALAHILVYENTSATGRHLCVGAITHYGDFAAKVAELYPGYNIPRLPKDTQPGLLRYKTASKKLMDLGLEFIPMEQIIKDSVESLKSKGFIS